MDGRLMMRGMWCRGGHRKGEKILVLMKEGV